MRSSLGLARFSKSLGHDFEHFRIARGRFGRPAEYFHSGLDIVDPHQGPAQGRAVFRLIGVQLDGLPVSSNGHSVATEWVGFMSLAEGKMPGGIIRVELHSSPEMLSRFRVAFGP